MFKSISSICTLAMTSLYFRTASEETSLVLLSHEVHQIDLHLKFNKELEF